MFCDPSFMFPRVAESTPDCRRPCPSSTERPVRSLNLQPSYAAARTAYAWLRRGVIPGSRWICFFLLVSRVAAKRSSVCAIFICTRFFRVISICVRAC
jgi:hypothetical protein